jgi:hypothetical protein
MSKLADISQMQFVSVNGQEGWSVPIIISEDELQILLDAYDPDNQFSPAAATSRELARIILDAYSLWIR